MLLLTQNSLATRISESTLNNRSKYCLAKHGVKTLKELSQMNMQELLKVRNLGVSSIYHIEKVTGFRFK